VLGPRRGSIAAFLENFPRARSRFRAASSSRRAISLDGRRSAKAAADTMESRAAECPQSRRVLRAASIDEPVKELFQGRRFGFAPRAAIAYIAVGIGIALTLSDLMAWFAWGGSDTNGYVVVSIGSRMPRPWCSPSPRWPPSPNTWTFRGRPRDREARLDRRDRRFSPLRNLDVPSRVRRWRACGEPRPVPAVDRGLLVTLVDAAVAANLYSAREWEELEEEPMREHRPRRRAVSR